MGETYLEQVTADALEYIKENFTAAEIAEKIADRDSFAEDLNDQMWIADSVTGNASGSYTFSRFEAKQYVMQDTETVMEALREFGVEAGTIADKFLSEDWEYFDVTARCYVLYGAIENALDMIAGNAEEV